MVSGSLAVAVMTVGQVDFNGEVNEVSILWVWSVALRGYIIFLISHLDLNDRIGNLRHLES